MTIGAMVLAVAVVGGPMSDQFQHDFRGGEPLPPSLTFFGPDAARVAKPTADGLQIRYSDKRPVDSAVGILSRFGISGDFEITLEYEILEAGHSSSGLGPGVKLWCKIGNAPSTLAQVMRPKKGNAFVSIFVKDGNQLFKQETTQAKQGRLRLSRKGAVLAYSYAQDKEGSFKELRRIHPVAKDDLRSLRISASPSNTDSPVSIRLTSLDIRADGLGAAATAGKKSYAGWIVAGLLVLLAVAGAGVFLWRKRRARDPADADQSETSGESGETSET